MCHRFETEDCEERESQYGIEGERGNVRAGISQLEIYNWREQTCMEIKNQMHKDTFPSPLHRAGYRSFLRLYHYHY